MVEDGGVGTKKGERDCVGNRKRGAEREKWMKTCRQGECVGADVRKCVDQARDRTEPGGN